MRKRLVAMILAFVTVMCLCSSASALSVQTFVDVPVDHPYFEAIDYLYQAGITNGIDGERFNPDERITLASLSIFCVKAFFPEEDLGDMSAITFLVKKECVRDGGLIGLIDFETGLGIIGRAAGVIPREDLIELDYTDLQAFRYVRDVGFVLNVMDIRDKVSTAPMTRGEAAYVVYTLRQWLNTKAAKNMTAVQRFGFNYIEMEAAPDYAYLQPYAKCSLMKVPFSALSMFRNLKYKIRLDDDYIDLYNKEHGSEAVALFTTGKKAIFSKNYSSILHEFGHFTQWCMINDHDTIKTYFADEQNVIEDILGSYALTDSGEYFAEFYQAYIGNQDNPDGLARLKSNLPETFNYFNQLENTNWRENALVMSVNKF